MSSVNEKLARAREQDLRRARNLQAKLRRTCDGTDPDAAAEPDVPVQTVASSAASSSSRAGLMYISSTEQAQRERDQRSRETQLQRQVAGPIPPESWRGTSIDSRSIAASLSQAQRTFPQQPRPAPSEPSDQSAAQSHLHRAPLGVRQIEPQANSHMRLGPV